MHDSEQHNTRNTPDELDVEIVDLDTPADKVAGTSTTQPTPSPLAPRFTLKQRRIQLIATASIVLLVLLVLIGSYGPTRTVVFGRLFPPPPSPTATLVPGIDRFYIQAHPAWGHLFIDGKLVKHIPALRRDAALRLGRGTHQLDWVAAPFESQHCVVSVPPRFGHDTCSLKAIMLNPTQSSAWLLTFSASMSLLPDTQRVALTQAIQTALDVQQSSEIVQPGEHYAVADARHPIAIATQPLRATLNFHIDTDTQRIAFCIDSLFGMPSSACRINNEDCRLLCETYFATPSTTPDEWITFGVVRTSWDYTTLDGRLIARDQPEIVDEAGTNEHILPLRISWDGSNWHVGTTFTSGDLPIPNANPVCFPAVDDFQTRGVMIPNIPNILSYNLQFVSGDVHATGCLVTLNLEQFSQNGTKGSNVPTPSAVSTAYVLQRFGIFLAINALAHTLWPDLPIANEYERSIAQQLAERNVSAQTIRWQE